MKKPFDPVVPVLIAAGAALFLALLGFAALFRQNISHDRLLAEYEAGRAASVLTEQLLSASFPEAEELPEEVIGFAIINGEGQVLSAIGSVPEQIDPGFLDFNITPGTGGSPSSPGSPGLPGRGRSGAPAYGSGQEQWIRGDGGRLILIRSLGGVGQGSRARQNHLLIYLVYDTGRINSDARLRLFLLSLALALFLLASGATWFLYRRMRTLRRELEEQRLLAELGSAARTLTHELKNPLAIIRMQSSLLEKQLVRLGPDSKELSPAITGSTRIINEETARISGLIDRVRMFLKGGNREQDIFDPVASLTERVERLPFPITMNLNGTLSPPEIPQIKCNRETFLSAMENLLVNAREAQEIQGGYAVHEVRSHAAPQSSEDTPGESGNHPASLPVELEISREGGMIAFKVCDQGPGIEPGDMDKLFHPFYTTKERGSGVGLALVKGFAESCSGSVRAENRTSGGACFTLAIPELIPGVKPEVSPERGRETE